MCNKVEHSYYKQMKQQLWKGSTEKYHLIQHSTDGLTTFKANEPLNRPQDSHHHAHNPNLPIIYDSPNRQHTPSKISTDSRMVFESRYRNGQQGENLVSGTSCYQVPVAIRGDNQNWVRDMHSTEKIQANNSRILMHNQAKRNNTSEVPVQNDWVRYQIRDVNNSAQPILNQRSHSPINFSHQQKVQSPPSHGGDSRVISQLKIDSVPRIQYDRCVIECKNWETKYNELYLKFLNMSSLRQDPHSEQKQREIQDLKSENARLARQLEESENKRNDLGSMVEENFKEMLEKQKQSTLRECELLLERYRLQSKE